MRERILVHGAETLADYELLEVLLFYAIPRRDTNPQAKVLLSAFGSIGKLLQASSETLEQYGLSRRLISLLELPVLAARSLMESDDDTPLQLSNAETLMNYLKGTLHRMEKPVIGLICLDSNNGLIAEETFPAESNLHAYHRAIAQYLLSCHATAAIIAYYHPRSPATALAPEVRGLKQALQSLSITLHESILIGEGWYVSMNETGLL
ncbi:DNA repair protein RadC [Bombella sp. TMW 2.2559]|uniref:DNA repair protein RadC n=1 Tax=Bombella dulcis TaxID=2967339 RepID=A0ABT3WFR9_9PROT|nr:JAB domain-containing protein [Bombella dulcis]MCX5615731.1 DNA repair protein RadC [Bombella dulcis]